MARKVNWDRTTYNLRYVDNGEWYRGYRSFRLDGAKTQAILVSCATLRQVAVYAGEGAFRAEVWRTENSKASHLRCEHCGQPWPCAKESDLALNQRERDYHRPVR